MSDQLHRPLLVSQNHSGSIHPPLCWAAKITAGQPGCPRVGHTHKKMWSHRPLPALPRLAEGTQKTDNFSVCLPSDKTVFSHIEYRRSVACHQCTQVIKKIIIKPSAHYGISLYLAPSSSYPHLARFHNVEFSHSPAAHPATRTRCHSIHPRASSGHLPCRAELTDVHTTNPAPNHRAKLH